jgi:hypothetical protein
LDVVARSTSGELLYKYWDSSTGVWWPGQTDWATLAVGIVDEPAIATNGVGKLDIVVNGVDNSVWRLTRSP